MSTTTINFTMKNLDGTVVPYTQFQIDSGRLNTGEIPDVMPASLAFTTDANGQASVVMTVTDAPYYLSKLDGSTDKVISYKFFVPASDVSLDAELLYVDLGKTSKFYNDKSVAALIEAKIVAVNAANRALQVVTTLGSLDTLRTNLGSIISVGTNIASVNTVATNIASVNAVNAASTTISSVNAALTNINAVGSSIASVDTVASNIGNVSTVAGMSSNIASVVANATDIDTVANNMTDVQAAASALPGLTAATTIAPYVTQITNVSNNITSVNAVGSNIANINDVAGMEADIEALADNLDNLAAAAAAVTQAVDAQKQLFLVGVDYTLGVSTALALTYVPAKANAVKVFFDGEYQTKDTFTVVHHTITFNSPITAFKVEVQYDVPSSFVGLTPTDLVTLQTAETNASNSASASAVSAAAALASEVDAQQSASAAAVSASSMQQATDAVKELFVSGIDYTINTSTTLTLANAPAKSNSVLVFFNGTYKHASTWNRVGASIIFNSPINVALVEVWYQVPSLLVALTPAEDLILTNAVNASQASADAAALSEAAAEAAAVAVAAAVDGVKDLYVAGTHYTKNVSTSVTLSAVPAKPNTVKVFFNGVYQNKDTYYSVGSTINFGAVGTPAVIDSDSVEVQYEIPSQFVGLSVGEQAVLTAAQSNALASANAAAGSAVDAEASANAMKISDYAALRTYSGTQTSVYVTTSGIAGHFIYDGLTAGVAEDNGGTVICAAAVGAKRWRRVFDGAVNVSWFGAVGDGVADDTAAIQAALNSLQAGGVVYGENSKNYGVSSATSILLQSNSTLDFNNATVTQLGTTLNVKVFKNKTYFAGGVFDENIEIRNVTIVGNGANGLVSDQGAAMGFYGINGCRLINVKTKNTNGDGLQFRESYGTVIRDTVIGNYGRNGISPTSGTFTYDNVIIEGTPFTGANPGKAFDAENNSATERGVHNIVYIKCSDMTFVDFYNESGGAYNHDIYFHAGDIGPSFNPFRILSRGGNTTAKNIYVGPLVSITCAGTNPSVITLENTNGVVLSGCNLRRIENTGSQNGILLMETCSGLVCNNVNFSGDFDFNYDINASQAVAFNDAKLTGTFKNIYIKGSDNNIQGEADLVVISGAASTGNVLPERLASTSMLSGATLVDQSFGDARGIRSKSFFSNSVAVPNGTTYALTIPLPSATSSGRLLFIAAGYSHVGNVSHWAQYLGTVRIGTTSTAQANVISATGAAGISIAVTSVTTTSVTLTLTYQFIGTFSATVFG